MVRLITTLLLCAFVGITASASQITEQQALQVAAKYADIDIKSHPQRMKAAGKQQKTAAYYAFNIGDNEGFVIVSGDDSLTELVGYSDSSSFDPDKIPDNMRSWLQAYSGYVASVQAGECKAKRQQINNITTITVRPFVTTKWNQYEPFNGMTPIADGENCVTGCVATAMAQIMKYYEWPERGEGSFSYTDDSGHRLSADFSQSVYDWENMLDEYNSYYDQNMDIVNEYNELQANAVAKLMLDCGISVEMDYSLYGSGAPTSNVATALNEYFNYTTDLYYRANMSSKDFMDKLLEELDNRRPVLFSGRTLESGHAFVADGYDSNNFLHINWGWGGLSDGYFNVNYLDPDNIGIGGGIGGYKYSQYFITSYPNFTGEPQETKQMSLDYLDYGDYTPGVFINSSQFQQSQRIIVSLSNVHNPNESDYSGEIGIAAFDNDGNMAVIHTSSQRINGFPSGTYYPGAVWEFSSDFSALPDGEYKICGISRQNSDVHEFDWIKFDSNYSLDIQVANGMVTVIPFEYRMSLAKQIEKPEKIYIGQTAEFVATIRNNSSMSADGTVYYEVRRMSDDDVIYASSIEAIVYDNNEYATVLSVPIESGIFEYSETYSIAITSFTLTTGEIIPVESEFGQCSFTIDEGVPQIQLSFYDFGNGIQSGISIDAEQFEKSMPQDVNVTYAFNPDMDDPFDGDISFAVCDADNQIVLHSPFMFSFHINPFSVRSSTFAEATPDMSELDDGLYSIIPLSLENGAMEWIRFDHPARIDIDVKGDYAYVRHYEYSVTQESFITAAGNLAVGGMATFNVDIRNNSNEETVGDLFYDICKSGGNVVYEGSKRIDLPAYATTAISIEQLLTNDIFSEGSYTIAITGYQSATHTDFTYFSSLVRSSFQIGAAGLDAVGVDRVTVYPNPAEDYVTVDCDEGIVGVVMYSVGGQIVRNVAGPDAAGSIYVGDLPAGYYIVSIETLSGATVRKQILKH